MKKTKDEEDGCVDVICTLHGKLGRTLANYSSILCKKCKKYIPAEAPKKKYNNIPIRKELRLKK